MKNNYEIRGDITAIFLLSKYGQMEVIIDTEDLPKVLEFPNTWFAYWNKNTKTFYSRGNDRIPDGKRISVSMHRFITNCPDGMVVDHWNHDTLDNRRLNLRIVTYSGNNQNLKGASKKSKSGIRGVYWEKTRGKWHARLTFDGKLRSLGRFDDINDARNEVISAISKYMPFSQEANQFKESCK